MRDGKAAASLAPAPDLWVEAAQVRARELAAGAPAWLNTLRERAVAVFARDGFPTRRDEEWRYTSVKPIVEGPFRVPLAGETAAVDIARYACAAFAGPSIILVDGVFRGDLSDLDELPEGLVVEPLSAAIARGETGLEGALAAAPEGKHPFRALNLASFADGAHIRVAEGVVCPRPVRILCIGGVAGAGGVHLRHRIVVAPGASVTVVEEYRGETEVLTNAVTDVEVGARGRLERFHLVAEDLRAHHIGFLTVRQEAESRVHDLFLGTGAGLVRNEIEAIIDGEHAECTLNGLYHLDGDRQVDNHTLLRHAKPNCRSWEVYRGVLDGASRGIFTGKIHVYPDAQKTDAKQSSNSLLLSRDAEADTRPRLEIHADDVKCTHGATVGAIEDAQLFYCRARGIPADAARRLLVRAFGAEVLEAVEDEAVRAELGERFAASLERGA